MSAGCSVNNFYNKTCRRVDRNVQTASDPRFQNVLSILIAFPDSYMKASWGGSLFAAAAQSNGPWRACWLLQGVQTHLECLLHHCMQVLGLILPVSCTTVIVHMILRLGKSYCRYMSRNPTFSVNLEACVFYGCFFLWVRSI